MDTVFSTRSPGNHAASDWSIVLDRVQLLHTLQQTAELARASGHMHIANFTQPVSPCDPIHILLAFQHLSPGQCFFWARPAEQRALVGMETATTIETTGPTCIATAAAGWRELQQYIISGKASGLVPAQTDGPVLFGGFRFDPLNQQTMLWQEFPDGLLVLPHLLFHCDESAAALTCNVSVQPADDYTLLADKLIATVQRLNALLTTSEPVAEPAHHALQLRSQLTPEAWMDLVSRAVKMIRADAFEKVVLARGIQVTDTERPFAIAATLQRLSASYPAAHIFAIERGTSTFVGATPERLVCGSDGQIQTMALAGSAPRGATPDEDAQIGNELLQSTKNRGEHRVVVKLVTGALSTICSRVWVAETPHLLKLKNIQHLETPITGDLLPGHSILEAIEDLHPTPAVGGFPRQPALAVIREIEQLDRGWYAGPIGWVGGSGNGEFAVALRSALIKGNTATLFTGCGIVADSDPSSELAESGWKLVVMLNGLAGED